MLEDIMNLYENVRKIAKSRGMSLQSVADKASLGSNTLYKWKTQTPRADTLAKVARVLGVTTADILNGNQPITKADVDLLNSIDNARSFDGKPISDKDREKVKNILRGYFED